LSGVPYMVDPIQFAPAVRAQSSFLKSKETGRPTGQHCAIWSCAQCEEGDIREMQLLVDAFEADAMTAEQSAVSARPDISGAILQDRADELVGQTLVGSE